MPIRYALASHLDHELGILMLSLLPLLVWSKLEFDMFQTEDSSLPVYH